MNRLHRRPRRGRRTWAALHVVLVLLLLPVAVATLASGATADDDPVGVFPDTDHTGVPVGDAYATPPGTVLQVDAAHGVLANDKNVDSSEPPDTQAIYLRPPQHGQAILNDDGSFRYDPDPGFNGVDAFTYCMSRGRPQDEFAVVAAKNEGYCSFKDYSLTHLTAQVTIAVNPPFNTNPGAPRPSPHAVDDSFTIVHDLPVGVAAPGVLVNDTVADADLSLHSPSTHGTTTLRSDGSFDYVPNAGFVGTDQFTYALIPPPPPTPHDQFPGTSSIQAAGAAVVRALTPAADLPAGSSLGTVTIDVIATPPTGPPIATNDTYSTPADTPLDEAKPGVEVNDHITGSQWISIATSNPGHGTAQLGPDGSLHYQPASGFSGTDTFTYCIGIRSTCESNMATVTITVGSTTTSIVATTTTSPGGAPGSGGGSGGGGGTAGGPASLPLTGSASVRGVLGAAAFLLLGFELLYAARVLRAKDRP